MWNKWKNLSKAKKGLVIGLVIGMAFAIHINVTRCYVDVGGGGGCHNPLEGLIALFEFLIIFPLVVILEPVLRFISSMLSPEYVSTSGEFSGGHFVERLAMSFVPILEFILLGSLIGYIIDKLKNPALVVSGISDENRQIPDTAHFKIRKSRLTIFLVGGFLFLVMLVTMGPFYGFMLLRAYAIPIIILGLLGRYIIKKFKKTTSVSKEMGQGSYFHFKKARLIGLIAGFLFPVIIYAGFMHFAAVKDYNRHPAPDYRSYLECKSCWDKGRPPYDCAVEVGMKNIEEKVWLDNIIKSQPEKITKDIQKLIDYCSTETREQLKMRISGMGIMTEIGKGSGCYSGHYDSVECENNVKKFCGNPEATMIKSSQLSMIQSACKQNIAEFTDWRAWRYLKQGKMPPTPFFGNFNFEDGSAVMMVLGFLVIPCIIGAFLGLWIATKLEKRRLK